MSRKITKEEHKELKERGFNPSSMTFINEVNGHKIIVDIKDAPKGSYYVNLKRFTPVLEK